MKTTRKQWMHECMPLISMAGQLVWMYNHQHYKNNIIVPISAASTTKICFEMILGQKICVICFPAHGFMVIAHCAMLSCAVCVVLRVLKGWWLWLCSVRLFCEQWLWKEEGTTTTAVEKRLTTSSEKKKAKATNANTHQTVKFWQESNQQTYLLQKQNEISIFNWF
mgnify:CR=1 FL=1